MRMSPVITLQYDLETKGKASGIWKMLCVTPWITLAVALFKFTWGEWTWRLAFQLLFSGASVYLAVKVLRHRVTAPLIRGSGFWFEWSMAVIYPLIAISLGADMSDLRFCFGMSVSVIMILLAATQIASSEREESP